MAGISLTSIANALPEDIAPLWRFECDLPSFNDINGNNIEAIPALRIQKCSIGGQLITSESIHWAGWEKNFATGSTTDDLSLTVLESADYDATYYFKKWKEVVHDDDGYFGLPGGTDGYWKNVTIYSLDVTGKRRGKFFVRETWPMTVQPYDFDGESTMALYVNVNMKANRVNFTKENGADNSRSGNTSRGTRGAY